MFDFFTRKANIFVVIIGLISLVGAISIAPLSISTFTGGEKCPSLFNIPACYIVFAGFVTMVIFSFLKKKFIFFIGWTPVAFIAFFASLKQYSQGNTCPLSSSGVPLCYYSLSVCLLVLLNFTLWFYFKEKARLS